MSMTAIEAIDVLTMPEGNQIFTAQTKREAKARLIELRKELFKAESEAAFRRAVTIEQVKPNDAA